MDKSDEKYADAVSIEPDGSLAGVDVQPEEEESSAPETEQSPVFRFSFFHRVAVHLALLVVIGGTVLSTVVAIQFRRAMLEEDERAATTVHTAVANYLAAHFRSHKGQFIRSRLDYTFRERFLKPEVRGHEPSDRVTHRPTLVRVHDAQGEIIYTFREDDTAPGFEPLPPEQMPATLSLSYDRASRSIRVVGPIAPEDEVVAYADVCLPTSVEERMRALYGQMLAVVLILLACGVTVSLLFARVELAPIRKLSEAAQAVNRGQMVAQVPVRRNDEVGDLTTTFNHMMVSLTKRLSLMHRMQDWIVKIGRELESERLHHTLVSMFQSMSTANACRLYLFDEKSKSMDFQLEVGGDELPAQSADPISILAVEERWAQYQKANGELTGDPAEGVELAIPLLSGTHRIGVVRLGRTAVGEPYDEETLTILHTLAQYASVAIDNADLYSQLAEKQRIEQEMMWARNIQQSMLPRSTPTLAGYEVFGNSIPATEVGGDYYDYVASPDQQWNIIIGDVSGKGVPAALIMSTVRSLIHSYLEFEASPGDMLTKVNRRLSENLDPDMFVTLSSLRLDLNVNKARVARAGHEPVMVRRASGQIENIAPPGAALGLLEVDRFAGLIEEEDFALDPDDVFLLYTDGITEARNTQLEDFGQERLEQLLARSGNQTAKEIYELIIGEVTRHAEGMAQNDDITLVVVRRNGA